jgi:cytochrome oxidase Cu insertion factor (SCO1/SenC/PrrC family)
VSSWKPGPLRAIIGVAILLVVVAACSSPSGGNGSADLEADRTWRAHPLTDVRTGDTFTVDDLAGKLVAVEPMAIWCTSCRAQQAEASVALERLASDDLVFIGFGVDPNEDAAALARFADDQGFDWTYVIASPESARALAQAFGPQVLSPPSTPMILVDPAGEVVDVHFGFRGAGDLVALLRQHLP